MGGFGLGSPPRGRGKEGGCVQRKSPARITPAWAGKRAPSRLLHITQRDHPRVGGEKGFWPGFLLSLQGSPPRGRGKVRGIQRKVQRVGITPAWAGKSGGTKINILGQRDHPRVGGEKCWPPPPLGKVLGSPPRGRGKEYAAPAGHTAAGITPAWAGKSKVIDCLVQAVKDHPRVGGEKIAALFPFPRL